MWKENRKLGGDTVTRQAVTVVHRTKRGIPILPIDMANARWTVILRLPPLS
jgi:hypothetical protein